MRPSACSSAFAFSRVGRKMRLFKNSWKPTQVGSSTTPKVWWRRSSVRFWMYASDGWNPRLSRYRGDTHTVSHPQRTPPFFGLVSSYLDTVYREVSNRSATCCTVQSKARSCPVASTSAVVNFSSLYFECSRSSVPWQFFPFPHVLTQLLLLWINKRIKPCYFWINHFLTN